MKRCFIKPIYLLILIIFFFSCGSAKKDTMSLKIGLMPAVDSAPMFIAEKKGYFEKNGLDIEIKIYTNAQNRQSALQTDSIDGAMTDLIAAAINVSGGFNIKATMTTNGMFPVLARPEKVNAKNIKLGLMEVSVSNYLADTWLSDNYTIEKVYVNEIPVRLEAVVSGKLDMGIFPEPIASIGEMKGLKKIIYEYESGYCPDVMVFTEKALRRKKEAITAYHTAYNMAVEDINKNKDEARTILVESIPNVENSIKNKITLPTYTKARLPENSYLQDIISWTVEVVDGRLDVTPQDIIDRRFVNTKSISAFK